MTDEEFDKYFAAVDNAEFILDKLAKMTNTIILNNGTSYHIDNISDVRAVVEQELYQQMTGRE